MMMPSKLNSSDLRIAVALQATLAIVGLTLISASFVAEGVSALLAFAMFVGALGAATHLSWRWARAIGYPYVWAVGTGVLMVLGGVAAGRVCFDQLLRRQIRLLESELRNHAKVPDKFDVESPGFLRTVWLSRGTGEGLLATFCLPDRSLVRYVSNRQDRAHEQARPCTAEIQPGWYRVGRCSER